MRVAWTARNGALPSTLAAVLGDRSCGQDDLGEHLRSVGVAGLVGVQAGADLDAELSLLSASTSVFQRFASTAWGSPSDGYALV